MSYREIFYDSSFIAAESKRDQYLKEAQDYHIQHHIITNEKPRGRSKALRLDEQPIYLANLIEQTSLRDN